jgi:hypothetical protein
MSNSNNGSRTVRLTLTTGEVHAAKIQGLRYSTSGDWTYVHEGALSYGVAHSPKELSRLIRKAQKPAELRKRKPQRLVKV